MTGCEHCGVGPEDECAMDCPSRGAGPERPRTTRPRRLRRSSERLPDEVIVDARRRVVRDRQDLVGNDLTATLRWCATHNEPVWEFRHGSPTCRYDEVTQVTHDHDIVDGPWELPEWVTGPTPAPQPSAAEDAETLRNYLRTEVQARTWVALQDEYRRSKATPPETSIGCQSMIGYLRELADQVGRPDPAAVVEVGMEHLWMLVYGEPYPRST